MQQAPETDPALSLIERVLKDLAVRSRMHLARRRQDGDAETFVIQTGEDGRCRLTLPDVTSDESIERCVSDSQANLSEVLGQPVPLCPRHYHALVAHASAGTLAWVCPDGGWRCELGRYEEMTWPQRELGTSLAPILMRRLARHGTYRVVRTIGVAAEGGELVADFGVIETSADLLEALATAAAPLPVRTHHSPDVMIRPLPGDPARASVL